jgi:hypothetical protein
MDEPGRLRHRQRSLTYMSHGRSLGRGGDIKRARSSHDLRSMMEQKGQKKPKRRHGGPSTHTRDPKREARRHKKPGAAPKKPKRPSRSQSPRRPVTDAALEARLRTAAPTDRERWEQHQHGLRSRYGAVPRDETASQETEEERTARMRRALGPRHVPPGTPRPRLTPEEQFSRLHAYQVKLDRFERETSLYDEEEQQRAKKQQVFDKHQTRFDPLKETIVPGLRPYTPPT